jgi:hypothetical protein
MKPGPAVHLVNLIPPAASLTTPSIPTVHEILERADLPLDTIALAVCILDSLNSKFSHSWRLSCPLAPVEAPLRRHTLPARPVQLHIDSVRPEVMILAALILAVKFLDDDYEQTQSYASRWGNDLWTCEQINVTERCIMENLGYRILPLWNRVLIDDALGDMERAGWQAVAPATPSKTNGPHQRSMSSGKAITGLGFQVTPVHTPKTEDAPGGGPGVSPRDRAALVRADIQAAFAGYTIESLHLPQPHRRNEGELQLPPHL